MIKLAPLAGLLSLLSACAAGPRDEVSVVPEIPRVGGSVLAFLAPCTGEESGPLRIGFASSDITIAPGDALEYDAYTAVARAHRAGVGIEFDDGRALRPPSLDEHARSPAAWEHVRVALDEFVGRRPVSFVLAAENAQAGTCAFFVDEVALVRADGAIIGLFRDGLPDGAEQENDAVTHASCRLAPRQSSYAHGCVPAWSATIGEPWALIDLSAARKKQPAQVPAPRVTASADGSEASDPGRLSSPPGSELPSGHVFLADDVPFEFASGTEAPFTAAAGQMLGFAPLEGGRYYELHLALAATGRADVGASAQLVGRRGETRAFELVAPARGDDGLFRPGAAPGAAGQLFAVISIPVAADFAIDGVVLPKDERIRVFAASVRWRKDAPADATFRRAWMTREVASEDLARYLRDLRYGPLFTEIEDENGIERALFDLLLNDDREGFDGLLRERLASFESRGRELKKCRVTFAGRDVESDARDGALGSTEVDCVREMRRAMEAQRAKDGLRWLQGVPQEFALLRQSEPALFGEIRERMASGAWSPASLAWIQGDCAGAGGESLARLVSLGARFARDVLGVEGASGWVPRDFTYARQLPQLWTSAGVRTLFTGEAPAESPASPYPNGRPTVFEWRAPDGSSVIGIATPATASGSRDPDRLRPAALKKSLDAMQQLAGARDIFVPVALSGAMAGIVRENLRVIEELERTDLAPEIRFGSPAAYIVGLLARPEARIQPWPGAKDGSIERVPVVASDRLRSANRRCEREIGEAEMYGALAGADGFSFPGERCAQWWKRLLSNENASAPSPAIVADAERILSESRDMLREELDVLSRAADTNGPGQALVVFNPLPWDRVGPVEIPDGEFALLDRDGAAVVSQSTSGDARVFLASVPSLGYAVYHIVPGPGTQAVPPEGGALYADNWSFANKYLGFTLDPVTGEMKALRLSTGNLKMLLVGNVLAYRATPTAVDPAPASQILNALDSIEIVEQGPLRIVVRTVRSSGHTRLTQDLVLYEYSPVIELKSEIEGFDAGGSLRVGFALRHFGPSAAYQVPFGVGSASATNGDVNARIPELSWVDQGDAKGGLALLEDFGSSFSVSGEILTLLLADGEEPGPAGAREFTYALLPHLRNWRAGRVVQAAMELNHPLRAVRATAHDGARAKSHAFLRLSRITIGGRAPRSEGRSPVSNERSPTSEERSPSSDGGSPASDERSPVSDERSIEGPGSGFVLSCLKPADGGDGWILRLFECHGQRGLARIEFDRPLLGAQKVDLLEKEIEALRADDQRVELTVEPFQIVNVRVRVTP